MRNAAAPHVAAAPAARSSRSMEGEAGRDGDRIWRPGGDDLWVDPRARKPDRTTAPIATALVDVSSFDRSRTTGDDSRPEDDGTGTPTMTEPDRPAPDSDGERPGGRPRERLRRAALAVAMIAVLVVTAVVVRSSTRPADLSGAVDGRIAAAPSTGSADLVVDIEPFAGADPRRLPDSAPVRWSRELDVVADRGSSMTVHRDVLAVGIFASPTGEGPSPRAESADPTSTVVGIDTTTGDTIWTADYPAETRALDVLGVIDDVIVLEWLDTETRALVGVDAADGTERWRLDTNDVGIHGIVPGTDLITRFSFSSTPRLTFLDPATGELAGRVTGRFVATDYQGRWWIRRSVRDGSLSVLDLRNGFAEPTPVSDVDAAEPDLLTVVDGVPIGTDDGRIVTPDAAGDWIDATVDSDVDPDPPDVVFAFSPAADDLFVFAGSGSVYGAVVVADDGDTADAGSAGDPVIDPATIDVRWRLGGRVARAVPSERGLLLVVEDEGGNARRVVDGPTGRVLVEVEDVDDGDLLALVGNGFLAARSAEFGVERVAYDLEGRELWTLIGAGPLEVGDGVVVNWSATPDGVRVTAFG